MEDYVYRYSLIYLVFSCDCLNEFYILEGIDLFTQNKSINNKILKNIYSYFIGSK